MSIVARDVVKRYSGREVLKQLNFELAPGSLTAIMGSSGGGKTTLLRCIAGLTSLSSGEITIDGVAVHPKSPARQTIGMVFQSAALFDYMNVEANVMFGIERKFPKLKMAEVRERCGDALATVGLADAGKLMPSELSGGMKKRAGIARAMVLEPAVMLYDEPTTGLDPILTDSIDSLMLEFCREKSVTSLVVSHDVASVHRIADRIIFLHQGDIAFDGSWQDFKLGPTPEIRDLIEKAIPAKLFAS